MTYWSLKGKKALIIDDSEIMRFVIRTMLQSLECESIKLAKDAKEALDLMKRNYFDFILCDLNLGDGKSGQQVLEEARYLELLPFSTVFIMITAENASPKVMGVLDWLPDDYIQKPITKQILITRLKSLLESKADTAAVSNVLKSGKSYDDAIKACDRQLEECQIKSFQLMKLKAELLLKNENYEELVDHCKDVLEAKETSSIELLLGQALMHMGQYKEAEVVLKKMIAQYKSYTLAYDLLAKVKVQCDDLKGAQRLLENAVSQSPNSILRQRELGEIAYQNGNYPVAEKAFRQAVSLGEFSCHKSVKDYTGLANTLVKNNRNVDAIKVTHAIKNDFQNDDAALLEALIVEAGVFKEMKKDDMSLQAAMTALDLFERNSENAPNELILNFAETCLALGRVDQSLHLVECAVRNKPDDPSMLLKVKEAYAAKSMLDKVEESIEKTSCEIKSINLRGMQLAQQGKVEEAVELFKDIANELPQNVTFNLNAAHMLIIQMTQRGADQENIQLAKHFLGKVRTLNPTNKKLNELRIKVNGLASKLGLSED